MIDSIKDKISNSNISDKELATHIFCNALKSMQEKVEKAELEWEDFTKDIIIEIINNQSDFICTVFKWQKNINSNTFKEYSHYLNVVAELLDLLER